MAEPYPIVEDKPYPIIEERALGRPDRGRLWGLGRRSRGWGEVPTVKGRQVRVFLVDGNHIVDHGHLADDDEQVVRASHVSVVDLTHDRAVQTELPIPSEDAGDFTLRVTFLCGVTDPAIVVREGQGDAGRALNGYVRSHHRLFQLGLQHGLSDVNQVRLKVQTQIEAYVQLKPPILPGLAVSLASVEVLTPDELAAYQGKVRKETLDHELERLRAAQTAEMARREQKWELERKAYELKLSQQNQYQAEMEQLGRQRLDRSTNDFTLTELDKQYEVIGTDPLKATMAARERGEISATEVADRLQAAQERREEQQERERERVFLAEQEERTRRYSLEDSDRQRELVRLEREYEAQQKELQRAYETDQGRELRAREDRLHMLGVRLDMLKEIAKHGHLNEVSLDPEQLINGIAVDTGATAAPLGGGGEKHKKIEAPAEDDDESDDDLELSDAVFREEDA